MKIRPRTFIVTGAILAVVAGIARVAYWMYDKILAARMSWVITDTWCLESPDCVNGNNELTEIARSMAMTGSLMGAALLALLVFSVVAFTRELCKPTWSRNKSTMGNAAFTAVSTIGGLVIFFVSPGIFL